MTFFEPIEGGIILLKQAGVYREAAAFVYDEEIYAQHGQGHIRLHPSGQTTANKVGWMGIDLGSAGSYATEKGKLVFKPTKKRRVARPKAVAAE